MPNKLDIPVDVARERVYRFRVTFEPVGDGFMVGLSLSFEEDAVALLQSPGRTGTETSAWFSALSNIATIIGQSVRRQQEVDRGEVPFFVRCVVVRGKIR